MKSDVLVLDEKTIIYNILEVLFDHFDLQAGI